MMSTLILIAEVHIHVQYHSQESKTCVLCVDVCRACNIILLQVYLPHHSYSVHLHVCSYTMCRSLLPRCYVHVRMYMYMYITSALRLQRIAHTVHVAAF